MLEGIAELDIWLKSLDYTDKGYVTSALEILRHELLENRFHTLIIRPCIKNENANKSHKKVGFTRSLFKPEKYYKKNMLKCLNRGIVEMEMFS